MAEIRLINNLKGVIYYMDTPLLDFEINNRELVKAVDLSNRKYYPWELARLGVSYGSINEFFERRTMKENCMFYREHLKAIGMDQFDFDTYIKKNNGNNHLDSFWVRFDKFGAKSFEEMCNQDYPVEFV